MTDDHESIDHQDDKISLKKLNLELTNLDKKYGQGTIMSLDEYESDTSGAWPSISTGVLSLDMILGIGGLPRGRIVELYGPEGVGKSTLSLSVVAEAQKGGGRAAYIDVEHALDPVYAKTLGVKLSSDKLIFSQPNSGEEALEIVEKLTRTGEFSVIVIDSVASLTPLAEIEGSMEQQQMGALPRLMGKAMRKLDKPAAKTGTLLLFVNQVRANLGLYGAPDITPGGRALKYAASVRIKLKRTDKLEDSSGEAYGIEVEARTEKNKMYPPFRKARFDIIYGRGVDNLGCIVDIAYDKGILTKSGNWYKFEDANIANGRARTIEVLANDLDFANKLKELILSERL